MNPSTTAETPSDVRTDVPALMVEELSAGYGSTTVLRDVSLTVPSGGAVALLGPNGAGKSTLLAALSGLLPLTGGRFAMHGEDVTGRPAHQLAAAGLSHIPEGRGVFRGLTVRENLVMQAGRGAEDEAIERAVSAFPVLGQRLEQQAGTMSGGQQQMLAMSAAYVRRPRLVLVDEASLGLAPLVVDEIFSFLGQLVADGAALLLVDQFAARALNLASYAYVLNRGRVVHHGSAADLDETTLARAYLGGES
ncbi:ABC branched-chain amino acid transporter, permease component (plasmid) [Rhodococcus jostii RHA1]|uniref:ABC branched-chain amino acid transporter, permease component n=1 Tax=Rhodococcus jostii (strain RHA1) TaxID=101510 RepID=Q0RW23_RHOJR|nr:ABC branched-chain amino acid transporter, permease component [Rhodococcus jostii RHA1]